MKQMHIDGLFTKNALEAQYVRDKKPRSAMQITAH